MHVPEAKLHLDSDIDTDADVDVAADTGTRRHDVGKEIEIERRRKCNTGIDIL